MVGCVGFSLQYEDGGSSKASECKGQVEKADGNGIEDVAGYLEGSKYGFYSRDAAVTVAVAFTSFKGTNLADKDIPDGYAGLDHLYCESQEQGDGGAHTERMRSTLRRSAHTRRTRRQCYATHVTTRSIQARQDADG